MPICTLGQAAVLTLVSVWVLAFSGPVFGFNSLYPVLYEEGIFASHCEAATECRANHTSEQCCAEQGSLVVQLSSMTLFAEDGVLVLYGELQDRFGARTALAVAAGILAVAFGTLTLNSVLLDLDALWFVGFFLVGFSGPGIFLSALSLSERFPRLEPIVTPVITSMFDASSLVFLGWSFAYDHGVSFAAILLAWLCLAVALSVCVSFLLPGKAELQELREESLTAALRKSMGIESVQGSLARPSPRHTPSRHTPVSTASDEAVSASAAAGSINAPHAQARETTTRLPREQCSAQCSAGSLGAALSTAAEYRRLANAPSAEPLLSGTSGGKLSEREGMSSAEPTPPPNTPLLIEAAGVSASSSLPSLPTLTAAPPTPIASAAMSAAPPTAAVISGSVISSVGAGGGAPPSRSERRARVTPVEATARELERREVERREVERREAGGARDGATHGTGTPRSRSSNSIQSGSSSALVAPLTHPSRPQDLTMPRHGSESSVYAAATTPEAMGYSQDATLCQMLTRYDTLLLVAFMSVVNLKQAFYMQTITQQLTVTWDAALAQRISSYFNLLFPLLALLSTPVAVALFARLQHRDDAYMAICGGLMCLYALASAVPRWLVAQYTAATLFGPSRTLLWAAYFHFFQNAARYPPSKLGRLIGYSNLLIAIVGDLPPILFEKVATTPATFEIIHAALALLGTVLWAALVLYLRATHQATQKSVDSAVVDSVAREPPRV